jgi:hypothetical protein
MFEIVFTIKKEHIRRSALIKKEQVRGVHLRPCCRAAALQPVWSDFFPTYYLCMHDCLSSDNKVLCVADANGHVFNLLATGRSSDTQDTVYS